MFSRAKKVAAIVTCLLIASVVPAWSAPKSITGSHGETLTVATTLAPANGIIKVQGAHFDETVGIYLAFCVLPKKGSLPTPCGGGINKSGIASVSYWISSNPPPYGKGLAQPFLPGGRFVNSVHVTPLIGKFDCRKVKCAITVRADHIRDGDRSYDIFIPITFPKKL
ncbi:MAG: hypothetical protein NTX12_06175 [Actinobacteria bacterium]|nr:hypothetical protein [Actinomycetota bacterium]